MKFDQLLIDYTTSYLVSEVTQNNVRTTLVYNATYNQVADMASGDIDGEWFKTSTVYTYDRQYVSSKTDEFGHTTSIYTNPLNGLVELITNANNNTVEFEYVYDQSGRLSIYKAYSITISTSTVTI